MSTEKRAHAKGSKVETSEADSALRNAQSNRQRRLQEVHDEYYSLDLKGAEREVPGSPAPGTYDGVDTYKMPQVNAHYSGGIEKSGFFTVPDNRYIVEVTYECTGTSEGDFCGWCYNPDGGYHPWIEYSEGRTKARWKRNYDGKPVNEVYKVYWKSLVK